MAKKILKQNRKRHEKKISGEIKNTDRECPVWVFTDIDRSGKFAFDLSRDDFEHKEVLEKMIHYSNMTWADIKKQTHDNGKSKHHLIDYEKMSKDAQDRLKAKHMEDDSDSMFSFAFRNLLRIIGIRRGRMFHILWYDPLHEICPSQKKHT
jgi:5S rRNA maturation endonuclease (ribonuclease M5)